LKSMRGPSGGPWRSCVRSVLFRSLADSVDALILFPHRTPLSGRTGHQCPIGPDTSVLSEPPYLLMKQMFLTRSGVGAPPRPPPPLQYQENHRRVLLVRTRRPSPSCARLFRGWLK